MDKGNIFVTSHPRIAPVLFGELTSLGFNAESTENMGVLVTGSFLDTMKMNLYLRTANRVLFRLDTFKAKNADDLYRECFKHPWEDIFNDRSYISVQSSVKNDTIRDNRFANLKLKDAIVDKVKQKTGRRPDSGADYSRAVIFLYWNENDVTVYFDTSGETISRRIYRKNPFKAPMNEALAAATILATGWDKKVPFVNPMCGSGTLSIEAALISMDIAPGMMRENFSFMHSKLFNSNVWRMLRNEALSKARRKSQAPILASDINPYAIKATKENAKNAGVIKSIDFSVCDFRECTVPDEKGIVFLNPEYGSRLGEANELKETYKEIGDFFKKKCSGYTGYVFTGNMDLAKSVGLATSRKIEFYNAKIDCRLLEYELYKGSKVNEKIENEKIEKK